MKELAEYQFKEMEWKQKNQENMKKMAEMQTDEKPVVAGKCRHKNFLCNAKIIFEVSISKV